MPAYPPLGCQVAALAKVRGEKNLMMFSAVIPVAADRVRKPTVSSNDLMVE
jgi:hypothetical protein